MQEIISYIIYISFYATIFASPIIVYFAIKYARRKVAKESMSEEDFQKNKNYYRDILKNYSAAELSYIDNFNIDIKREIVSTLLNLKLKGKVEIGDNQILILDTNTEGLKKTEKYILKTIKNGKLIINNKRELLAYTQEETLNDELIKKSTYKIRKTEKEIVKVIIIFAIAIFLPALLMKYNYNMAGIIPFTVWPICVIALPIYIASYDMMQAESYSRTEKGEEINKKIEGLKQYINDYSLLHEKDEDDLSLWEEYLVYSVIFNLNTTDIVEKISKLIEIEIS